MNNKNIYLILLVLAGLVASGCGPAPTPIPVSTATFTTVPSATATATATLEPTAAPTDSPSAGTTQVSPKDGMTMVYIPAGEFSMGSLDGTVDEQPVHTVYLDGYWIDKTEITNEMYRNCWWNGPCLRPERADSNTHFKYFFYDEFANYPVVDLRWSSAETYCSWAGRRMPSEAEWEKAARGTDGRAYPWGNENPKDSLLNFNHPLGGDTSLVGYYLSGASPYGALDMAGNLTEWVADWYAADYYANSPSSNPTGPVSGENKVLRGGSWYSDVYEVRSADRHYTEPNTRDIVIGFRCAQSAP